MLFPLLKQYARLAINIYCRKIVINNPSWLQAKGPLLLACNHPNSVLDGMILTTLFNQKIYTLARGDAFRNPKYGRLLRGLNLLPVYRTSEGVENLEHNYATFGDCLNIFRQGGIVIIFSEGRCINEWRLRPLKKGTARLATAAWQKGINLTVLPVGLNYNHFRNFGKNVFINFGRPLDREEVMAHEADGKMFLSFNQRLRTELQGLVYEIASDDTAALKQTVFVPQPLWKKVLLALPAATGFLIHAPLYFAAKTVNQKHFNNDHFDSTLVAMLMLAYPIYLLVVILLTGLLYSWLWAVVVLFFFPFTAWACVQLKPQLTQ